MFWIHIADLGGGGRTWSAVLIVIAFVVEPSGRIWIIRNESTRGLIAIPTRFPFMNLADEEGCRIGTAGVPQTLYGFLDGLPGRGRPLL
jgi:hypothetical protein